jgi:hypothetical protein
MRQGSKDTIKVAGIIENSEKYVFVWGITYYDDGYGVRRFTRFCHRYAVAGYNRGSNWNTLAGETQCIISADKARYHETGNEAD